MSHRSSDDDKWLRAAVQDGLLARDRAIRPPGFASVWQAMPSAHRRPVFSRPAFAAFAAVAALAGLSWVFLGRHAPDSVTPTDEDATALLARELSSPDYWRVPTDELLAFAAPPLRADLPSPEGFHVSLEESLL